MMSGGNSVTIVEVSPRDGMQSFETVVESEKKIAMIDLLSATGIPVIEVTGFARPGFIPNLADAEAVVAGMTRRPGTTYRGLAPNNRGAERAVAAGVDQILGLTTASETYTSANQNMTVRQATDQCLRSYETARNGGVDFVMAIGMAFWCPYEGSVDPMNVMTLLERGVAVGIGSFVLGGSLGMEGPSEVRYLFGRIKSRWPQLKLGYHVHNMAGMAPANILAAIDGGATLIESAICGLGGGVASSVSSGNYPTEDLVRLLNRSDMTTGVETRAVIEVAKQIEKLLGIEANSHAIRFGTRRDVLARSNRQPEAP